MAPDARGRRNVESTGAVLLAPPVRPACLPPDRPWHAETRRWWDGIWAAPGPRAEWVDADVPGLVRLAALVDRSWSRPTTRLAAEVRAMERQYGLPPSARPPR